MHQDKQKSPCACSYYLEKKPLQNINKGVYYTKLTYMDCQAHMHGIKMPDKVSN